jgi:two-component system response regulator RegA
MSEVHSAISARPDACRDFASGILLLDEDAPARERLAGDLAGLGFRPMLAGSLEEAMTAIASDPPSYAVVNTHLCEGAGTAIIESLRDAGPAMRIVVVTAYGSIASAVAAVKAGAVDYLPKPAATEDVVNALLAGAREQPRPPRAPMSIRRTRWEHIQEIFEDSDRNISVTARRLRMHRRTLQRVLQRGAPAA